MRYFFLCILLLSACTDSETSKITQLLEARDNSISHKDIQRYTSLLSETYRHGQGASKIEAMAHIFSRFDSVVMNSQDRVIHLLDEGKAICEQKYTLKVLANGEWREIVQREQLTFILEKQQWKISSGI